MAITAASVTRPAIMGNTIRTAIAAIEKAPSKLPMVEADSSRSCPITGTTKVWTSQHEAMSQLMSNSRRKPGSRVKLQTVGGASPVGRAGGGS